MFAVPGWSVALSALTTQKLEPKKVEAPVPKLASRSDSNDKDEITTGGKKRKRSNGKSTSQDVNARNLADLWDTVIEGNEKPKIEKDRSKQRQKPEAAARIQKLATSNSRDESDIEDGQNVGNVPSKDAKRERRKKRKEHEREDAQNDIGIAKEAVQPCARPPSQHSNSKPVESAAKLTPLQASMRQKLVSARFRHLNQTLYTNPSKHALELFQQNPELFQEYHEGFRRQVEIWPENPVHSYIDQIKLRAKLRGPQRGKDSTEAEAASKKMIALPRTNGVCNIADLGCGDAVLSQGLEKEKKRYHIQVISFDLQSPSPLVTKADIASLPLADDSVDVAIFCLALMGTNWIDFIEEAFRVLRWKGELWVAEIKSRFGRVSGKGMKLVDHSVGNRKKQDKKHVKKMEEEADDATALVEVDGHEMPHETDVSAFVEVLKKRGFTLQSENGVDLSNRMFVTLSFVKNLTPIKGKCVPVPKGMDKMGMDTWKRKPKAKFIDEEEVHIASEASVLKPCVYKIR